MFLSPSQIPLCHVAHAAPAPVSRITVLAHVLGDRTIPCAVDFCVLVVADHFPSLSLMQFS